jgi:hypothetical protein
MSPELAHPPRYWWLKRLAATLALAILLLLMLRIPWGMYASKQLADAKTRHREAGGIVDWSQAIQSVVSAEENALPLLIQAAGLLYQDPIAPSASSVLYRESPPFQQAYIDALKGAYEGHAPGREMIRKALQRPKFELLRPRRFSEGLNELRHVSYCLGDWAIHAHIKGDDREALEYCEMLLTIAQRLESLDTATALEVLIASGVRRVALTRLNIIASGMRVSNDDATCPTPDQIRRLVNRLLQDDYPVGMARAGLNDAISLFPSLVPEQARDLFLIRPYFDVAEAQHVRQAMVVHDSLAAPTLRQALQYQRQHLFGEVPESEPIEQRLTPPDRFHLLMFGSRAARDSLYRIHYLSRAERAVTAISLAANLYRLETGRWPTQLEELVPHYMLHVPIDPFGDGSQPLGYLLMRGVLPDGGDRPLVYFRYELEGALMYRTDEPQYDMYYDDGSFPVKQQRIRSGQVRDIARWSPPPGPGGERPSALAPLPIAGQ